MRHILGAPPLDTVAFLLHRELVTLTHGRIRPYEERNSMRITTPEVWLSLFRELLRGIGFFAKCPDGYGEHQRRQMRER